MSHSNNKSNNSKHGLIRLRKWSRLTQLACARAIVLSLLVAVPFAPSYSQEKSEQDQKHVLPSEALRRPKAIQREVSFETRDGWTIHATYTVPQSYRQGRKLPAALLLHSALHSQMVWMVYPGWVKIQESIVTLRIDWRGRGKSRGRMPFAEFDQEQRESVALDVKAALDFLASQEEVDASRLGVVGVEFSVGPAVMGAMGDRRARAFVLISGILDEKALSLIEANQDKQALFIVSKEDKESLASMAKAYSLNGNEESDIRVENGLGSGLGMGSVWRNRYPDQPADEAIDFAAGEWLVNRLLGFGQIKEVTFRTPDGWQLYANLGLPGRVAEDNRAPGVILLPTALSDRASFYELERILVGNNIAVLNLDWRSIGQSTNKGTLIEMPLSEMPKAVIDVEEGYKFLVSTGLVDPERVAVIGSNFGAKLAMKAAREIPRLKAVVMLTPVVKPPELAEDCDTIKAANRPVFLVTGDGFGDTTGEFVEFVKRDARNTVVTYQGAIIGASLFGVDKSVEARLIEWLKEKLAR